MIYLLFFLNVNRDHLWKEVSSQTTVISVYRLTITFNLIGDPCAVEYSQDHILITLHSSYYNKSHVGA